MRPGLVRIRAKAPTDAGVLALPASWNDLEVFVVALDGTETPLSVESLKLETRMGEFLTASLVVFVEHLDVTAAADLPEARST